MTKPELYNAANNFAFANIATADPVAFDIAAAEAFQKLNLNPGDYPYWKQTIIQQRANYAQISKQKTATEQAAEAAATEAAAATAAKANADKSAQ